MERETQAFTPGHQGETPGHPGETPGHPGEARNCSNLSEHLLHSLSSAAGSGRCGEARLVLTCTRLTHTSQATSAERTDGSQDGTPPPRLTPRSPGLIEIDEQDQAADFKTAASQERLPVERGQYASSQALVTEEGQLSWPKMHDLHKRVLRYHQRTPPAFRKASVRPRPAH